MEKPVVDINRNVKLVLVPEWTDKIPHIHRTYQEPGHSVFDDGSLWFACPGCGQVGGITVGMDAKPESKPSWQKMEGDPADPTTWSTVPSIHCVGCCGWHGWLTKGVYCHKAFGQ